MAPIKVTWTDCGTAVFDYDLDLPPLSGTIELERITPDNVNFCEALR